MKPWRVRLAVRRSRVQWALLCVVVLVSILSATMLASLFLLGSATERFAAREALTNADIDAIRVSFSMTPTGGVEPLVDAAQTAASDLMGDIPFTTPVHITGKVLDVPRVDQRNALGYFAFHDGIDQEVVIDDGRWPETVGGGGLEVAMPVAALDDLGLDVGDTFEVYPYGQHDELMELQIVGSFRAREPDGDFWRHDANSGTGWDPNASVPQSGGRLTTDRYGPLVITRDEIGGQGVANVEMDVTPDFAAARLTDVAGVVTRLETAEHDAQVAIGTESKKVMVLTTAESTLGRVLGSLAVTRSSVLVTGLLLLVLAIAALAQTSRLMAERRHAEQHLMRARGASSRQLLSLGVIEGLVLCGLTAALSPLLARAAYRFVARTDTMRAAGMDRDPGLPPTVWALTATVGIVLVFVLAIPLMRRGGTFVEGEQARSRPSRASAFQRSGIDFALVALAILAYLQLRSYQSPVMIDGGVARVDPLLAAGPALALLAGALVCVRLIPSASKALEGVASRGRGAVAPLAAWEVGRRSARAVSAVLLLTLAVSVGSFAMSFLSTWHTSQRDQAGFRHPADVEVTGLTGGLVAQATALTDDALGATVAPVFESDAEITASLRASLSSQGFSGRPVHLVATTDAGLAALTEGRVATEGGQNISDALARDDTTAVTGLELPGEPSGIEFTLRLLSSDPTRTNLRCTIRIVVLDGNGLYTSLDAGTYPLDGKERVVRALVQDEDGQIANLAAPARVVGIQTLWFAQSTGTDPNDPSAARSDVDLELSIDTAASLIRAEDLPVVGLDPQFTVEPATVAADVEWFGRAQGVVGPSLQPQGDQVHVSMTVPGSTLASRTVSISQGSFPYLEDLPVVANDALLARLGSTVGSRGRIQVDDVVLTVRFVDSVGMMPAGSPRNPSVIANFDDLQIMLMQAGAPAPGVTAWWADVPADNLDRYLDHLPVNAVPLTRVDAVRALTDDPLRVGIQAALWVITAAAIALAAVGFGVHTVVTVRSRELEFAQLRAVGLARSALTRLIAAESALLALLGTVFGVGLGVALSYLVAPLISVGADGRPPTPGVVVAIPWGTVGLLAAEIAAVLGIVVFFVSLLVRRINPAALLRVEG